MSIAISLVKGLGKVFVSAGFRRYEGRVWIRDFGDIVHVIQLHKPLLLSKAYIEFGVVLKEIWPTELRFKSYRSNIVFHPKLGSTSKTEEWLKRPQGIVESEVDVDILGEEVKPIIVKFFEQFDSVEKLRQYASLASNLAPKNDTPHVYRPLGEWAGFDYSGWTPKPK